MLLPLGNRTFLRRNLMLYSGESTNVYVTTKVPSSQN